VLNFEYAEQIARDWNARSGSYARLVTRFEVQTFGRRGLHEELWVPAEELEELNRHIVGKIAVEASAVGRK
jgi:hypothetical protein